MIQTLPCPGCKRTLVLAAETSLKAVLRCRHCSQEFVLGEMIEAELGYWEVVSDPEAPEPKYNGDSEVAADDAVLELSKTEFDSPQTLLKKQAESKKVDWSKFEPISHEQYERMRRKGKSPVWSMLSVLLGGLASIPIATLLIWHVLGKDPLQMGPVIGRFAPWIVPTRFQPNKFADEDLPPPPLAGTSGFRRFDNVTTASADSEIPSDTETIAPSLPARIRERGASHVTAEPLTSARANSLNNEGTAADVFTMINRVEVDLEDWSERSEDRDLQKKIALRTYSDLASLALAIEQLPSASPIRRLVRSELQSVGKQVAAHSDVQQLVQSGSRFWIANQNDDLIGLAIVIKIARATEIDDAWLVTPEAALGSEPIQIKVPKEIVPPLSEGQIIFATGCLAREKSTVGSESEKSASISSSKLKANFAYILKP